MSFAPRAVLAFTAALSTLRAKMNDLEVVDVFREETGAVRLLLKLPQGVRQFDRPRDQQLEKCLQRILLTLKKGPKKKRKEKDQAELQVPPDKDVDNTCALLDDRGGAIEDVDLAEAFGAARAPSVLQLGQSFRLSVTFQM